MGHAIVKAANRQPLTEEARVHTHGAVRERIGRYNQVLTTDVSVQLESQSKSFITSLSLSMCGFTLPFINHSHLCGYLFSRHPHGLRLMTFRSP